MEYLKLELAELQAAYLFEAISREQYNQNAARILAELELFDLDFRSI